MDKIKEFENELALLNNQELVEKVELFVHKEKKIGDAILIGLKEIKSRRVYNWLGYSSMFDLLVKYYKLSEAGAYQRLNALKVIEAVPEAQNLLVSGDVTMGTLSEMQSFINKQEKATGETVNSDVKKQIVEEIKNKSVKETREYFVEKNPSLNLPPDKQQKITSDLTLVQMKLDSENMKLIEELKSELSHKIPDGNWNEVMKVMLTATLEQVRKKKGINIKADGNANKRVNIKADKGDNANQKGELEFKKVRVRKANSKLGEKRTNSKERENLKLIADCRQNK
jgi:hypothetical protein